MNFQTIRSFIRISRPIFLLGAALVYALGVGIAKYLGFQINWEVYILGQLWVTGMQLTALYISEYFDFISNPKNVHRTLFSNGSNANGENELPANVSLYAAITSLTAVAISTFDMLRLGLVNPAVALVMALIFLGALFYSLPPVRLITRGYGELTISIIVANLVPALGFILQSGEFHRLLSMSTFPLTFLFLALNIAYELPNYASDLKNERQTLLIRLGWQKGMVLHNVLILTSFLMLGLAMVMGLPIAVSWQGFLALPLGLFQIWYLSKIEDGIKPQWSTFKLSATALFGLMAYLMAFAFWVR